MSDHPIKITRSAGTAWPTRFGPTPPGVISEPDSHAVAASVQAVAASVGPLGNNVSMPTKALDNLADVDILNVQNGDVLRYADSRWRNYNEKNLTDGGNF